MPKVARALPFILLLALAMTATAHAQPAATETLEVRAKAALDRGDYLSAIPLLLDALALRPTADTYLNLGNAYRQGRDWQKAEDTLEEGTERYPEDPRLSTALANAYLGAGDLDGARAALQRALRIDPTNAAAADLIAAIELSEGE